MLHEDVTKYHCIVLFYTWNFTTTQPVEEDHILNRQPRAVPATAVSGVSYPFPTETSTAEPMFEHTSSVAALTHATSNNTRLQ